MDTDHAADHEAPNRVDETAVALLLRSPHLEVGQIMELMDIGDREFRDMASRNGDIAQRLEERRLGTLRPIKSEPRRCKSCREWFVPYGHDRYCFRCLQTHGAVPENAPCSATCDEMNPGTSRAAVVKHQRS